VPTPQITVRFWAGAQRAAGHDTETLSATTVGEVRALLAARPELSRICAVASFLVDGRRASDATVLGPGAQVDVLPPFAGGSAPLIIGIGGSARPGSLTNELIARCLDEVAARGARTQLVPAEVLTELPLYSDDVAPHHSAALVEAVRAADCVVLGTPGYHGGMSGLVKNAIDHLEALRDDPRPYLDGRAVGIIVTAAGWQACGSALQSVRSAVHALRGWPTPFGMAVNSAEQTADDPRIAGALAILADQLTEFAAWQAAARVRR
jgi:FMN reductase